MPFLLTYIKKGRIFHEKIVIKCTTYTETTYLCTVKQDKTSRERHTDIRFFMVLG